MANIPVAVQMYTLREESKKDFIGTLEKVSDIGYQGVEFAGYYDMSAKDLKKVMDDLGLMAASSHIPLTTLKGDLSSVIAYQHEIESTKLVCPFIAPEMRTEEGYSELIRSLNDIGRECSKEGITLCYHNHDFELERLSNGKTALETILEETNPEWVKAEFDIYWLTRAGENPVEWMKRYQDRTPLVHLKDMTTDGEQFFAELGTGGVDLNGVLNQGDVSNVDWWIVEQDKCKRSPLESIEMSMNYFLSKHS
ncbi:sugar phosphate isomerase/epimerase family protein [Guptibacillus hwajinpoensis]|uniref:sugar phosphate isomerase/epimerase family protein n=1 Tax=Guptibacillus hwajinpoensis TaxID=208199 RepID=UPI001CFE67D5|nr:sugar phosphate isomerase/epimerase [Pseudalkalibacillus hwajinpoensis]WLR61476.1 sugar phosphate isomerase/epimerase [Pseudalkalibacillus hwajinpoensis]